MTAGDEQGPSRLHELIREFLERDQEREPAERAHTLPPGFYDDYSYPYQDADEFGMAEYQQELKEIRRLRVVLERKQKTIE